MNNRFKLALTLLTTRHHQQGFALVMTFCVGLVLLLTAATMMTRSTQDQESSASQRRTLDASVTANTAFTRVMAFFNEPQHRILIDATDAFSTNAANPDSWVSKANVMTAHLNQGHSDRMENGEIVVTVDSSTSSSSGQSQTQDPNKFYPLDAVRCGNNQPEGSAWNNYSFSSSSSSSSPSPSPSPSPSSGNGTVGPVDTIMLSELITRNWIAIDSNNPKKGAYRLRDYTVSGGQATLQIEARAENEGGNPNDLSMSNSTRAIEVTLPIIYGPASTPGGGGGGGGSTSSVTDVKLAGLWASDFNNEDSSKISSFSSRKDDPPPIQGIAWVDCNQKSDWEKEGGGYLNDYTIKDEPITIGQTDITPVREVVQIKTTLPGTPNSVKNASFIESFGSVVYDKCHLTLPRGVTANGQTNTSTCSGSKAKNFSGTDTPTNGIYYYKFDRLEVNSGQVRVNVPAGQKVVIYVVGEVKLSGTSTGLTPAYCTDFRQGGPNGKDLKVYAYIGNPDDASQLEIYHDSSDKILVGGRNLISGFIHAPKTDLIDISQGQIRGVVWTKAYQGSNSSGCTQSFIQQDVGKISWIDEIATAPVSTSSYDDPLLVPYLGPIQSWKTIEQDTVIPQVPPSPGDFIAYVPDGSSSSSPSPSPSASSSPSPSPSPSASATPEEPKCTVPNVVGMATNSGSKRTAVKNIITNADLKHSRGRSGVNPGGVVQSQNPPAGTEVDCQSTVTWTTK